MTTPGRPGSLWGHRDFRRLWVGDTVSQVGTQVSFLALPLVAVLTLDAGAAQVGVLAACESAAFLLVGLPAGAWVDRVRRRPVLVVADLGRAAALASIPVAALLGALGMAQLYAVALVTGLFTVVFDVAYQSYLPALVGRGQLVEGNAKLQASASAAQVGGPGLGGALVQAVGAPYAVALDALSFLVSAAALATIETVEASPRRVAGSRLRAEIAEGLRFVLGHPLLRAITGCTATSNFFAAVTGALTVLFLVDTLGLSPAVIGLVFGAGAVGGLAGALLATRIAAAVGSARALIVSILACTLPAVLVPLARPGVGGALAVGAATFLVSLGTVVYNVIQVSFRQGLCPPRLLGRMNATIRFVVHGVLPLGALAAAVLGTWLGLRPALWVGAAGGVLAVGWLLASPLRGLRDIPPTPA